MEENLLPNERRPEPFDPHRFWSDEDYFTSPGEATDERVAEVEKLLGYKLPALYVELLRIRNGGSPINTCFPVGTPDDPEEWYYVIESICGLGGKWGLDSDDLGSRFMIEEWGYPEIGIVFGESPSGGHDAMMLDYRGCGPQGEPAVVHVSVETDEEPTITPLADSFEQFVRALVHRDVYDTSEEDKRYALEQARSAPLTPLLRELCDQAGEALPDAERIFRRLIGEIVEEKGFFALHADSRSHLAYDLQFLLYVHAEGPIDREAYLKAYESMLVFGPAGTLKTGGYAPGFVADWLDERLREGKIVAEPESGGLAFADSYAEAVAVSAAAYRG